jgi:3-hydroxyisobutyrate dehydrogenase-like beta-hydroxyacid dehydrogenase
MKIGFIGLGNMGEAIAKRLIDAGHELRVWNRTPDRARQLAQQGAQVASDPKQTIEPGGVLISSLANDQALEQVIDHELLQQLGKGGVHISTSTVSPTIAKKMTELHAQFGVAYLAAPVLGRPDIAAAGKLSIFLAGSPQAKEKITPILQAFSQRIFDLGNDPPTANVLKLICNFLLASNLEAIAEALALGQKNGLDRNNIAEIFSQTLLSGSPIANYAKQIAKGKFEPVLFKLALGLKDINLVLSTATASKTPMPLASLLHDRLTAAVAKDRGNMDWSGLAAEVFEAAGLHDGAQS